MFAYQLTTLSIATLIYAAALMDYYANVDNFVSIFDACKTRQCFNITVINDETLEKLESFSVRLNVFDPYHNMEFLGVHDDGSIKSSIALFFIEIIINNKDAKIEIVDDRNECKDLYSMQ